MYHSDQNILINEKECHLMWSNFLWNASFQVMAWRLLIKYESLALS